MRITVIFFFILLTTTTLHAQDANYWTSPYSNGGGAVPGAFVSWNNDSGVLYRNPALLANTRINAISLNTTAYSWQRIKLKNGAGEGYDLVSSSTAVTPLLAAGNFKLPFKKPFYIGYGIINTPGINYAASQRRDNKANVLDDSYSPGEEEFVGQLSTSNRIGEFIGTLAGAVELSEHWSAGLSLEGLKKNGDLVFDYQGRAQVSDPELAGFKLVSNDTYYNAKYNHYSLTARLGAAFNAGRHHFGLLVTLPSWGLRGRGLILSDLVANNIDWELNGNPFSLLANTRQDQLKVKLKTPGSFALGYSTTAGRVWLGVTAEYFTGIKEYIVVEPSSAVFIRPDTGYVNIISKDLLMLRDARKAVVNVGVSANYLVNEKLSVLASVRSDQTAADPAQSTSDRFYTYVSDWNIWHVQGGISWKREKYKLQAVVFGGFGKNDDFRQDVNFSNVAESNFMQGVPAPVEARFLWVGATVSYIHNF